MDDVTSPALTRPKRRLSTTEAELRRDVVRQADANNRLEGVYRGPETERIVEAFVRGDIEVTDMARLFRAQPEPT